MGIKDSTVPEMRNTQGDSMRDHIKKVEINLGMPKKVNQDLIKMISTKLQITDLKRSTEVERMSKKELKIIDMKINTNKVSSDHAKMMVKNPTEKITTDRPSPTPSSTNQTILKSSITLQPHKNIQMKDEYMKSQEKSNIVMKKSVDNMKKNLTTILKILLDTGKITDTRMIIDIKTNLDTETTTRMNLNTGNNLVIEMMTETKNSLTKKFPFKVVNLHKRKNHPLLIKQWMFNNSIDTWFRIL